jgi:hypothetical protein
VGIAVGTRTCGIFVGLAEGPDCLEDETRDCPTGGRYPARFASAEVVYGVIGSPVLRVLMPLSRCLADPPPLWWSPSAARAHAVVVSVLTPAEVLIAARRLAGARHHLAAVAGIVHSEDLWQLCRDELTGVDVRIDGWDIRGRWFGVVIGATPRTGELRRGQTIPWRVIAAQLAPANAATRTDRWSPP